MEVEVKQSSEGRGQGSRGEIGKRRRGGGGAVEFWQSTAGCRLVNTVLSFSAIGKEDSRAP